MRERGIGITGTCTAKSETLKRFATMKAQDAKKDEIPLRTLFAECLEDELIQYVV